MYTIRARSSTGSSLASRRSAQAARPADLTGQLSNSDFVPLKPPDWARRILGAWPSNHTDYSASELNELGRREAARIRWLSGRYRFHRRDRASDRGAAVPLLRARV